MLREQATREVERVMHVGAVHALPPGGGELPRLHLARVVAEADQVQRVVRVPSLDQRVERERHLLRVHVVTAERHREREVEQQRGRRLGALLGLEQLEVVGFELHPPPRPASGHGVEDAPLHRDLPGVAEPPRPRGTRRLGEAACLAGLVHALAVATEVFEHPDQRALPHLARTLRGDLEPSSLAGYQAGPLERAFDLLQATQVRDRVLAQSVAQ